MWTIFVRSAGRGSRMTDGLSPADVPEDENPFTAGAEDMAEDPAAEPDPHGDKPGWYRALRSADPPASPATVEGNFSTDADPMEHVECAFIKITGSDGLEAWMHFVAAFVLVMLEKREDAAENQPAPSPDVDREESGGSPNFTREELGL